MRRALTLAIVLFWLVMVRLLVHQQAPPPSAPQAPLAAGAAAERDEWFGVAQYLAPAPFIESADAAIVATARSIVGSGRDATAAARAGRVGERAPGAGAERDHLERPRGARRAPRRLQRARRAARRARRGGGHPGPGRGRGDVPGRCLLLPRVD